MTPWMKIGLTPWMITNALAPIGYEPGRIVNLTQFMRDGIIIRQNKGGVMTQIMPNGSIIVVDIKGIVILWLMH
jgi:hypothetical protein